MEIHKLLCRIVLFIELLKTFNNSLILGYTQHLKNYIGGEGRPKYFAGFCEICDIKEYSLM